ncbi:MAG: VOC family protein [Bacteroidota bacterium]
MIKNYYTLIITIFIVILSSCSPSLTAPPITAQSNDNYVQGKFVWHDLLTTKVEESKIFYSKLFGWEFDTYELANNYNYTMIYKWGRPIGGIVDVTKFDNASTITQWVSSISVFDINQSIETAKKLGAKLYGDPLKIEGRGYLALAADSEGAAFAMLQSTSGTPEAKVPQNGDWLWNEYWTLDIEKPAKFYSSLFGYTLEERKINNKSYKVLSSAGISRAGITVTPNDKIKNAWFTYIYVENIDDVISKVEKFGGKVLLQAHKNPNGSLVAVITDPGGAGILLRTIIPEEMEMIKEEIAKN